MKFRILMQHVNNISENKAQTIKFTSLGRQRRCVSQCLRICWGVCRFFFGSHIGARMRHRRSNVLIAYLSLADLLWYICFVMRVPSHGDPAKTKKR